MLPEVDEKLFSLTVRLRGIIVNTVYRRRVPRVPVLLHHIPAIVSEHNQRRLKTQRYRQVTWSKWSTLQFKNQTCGTCFGNMISGDRKIVYRLVVYMLAGQDVTSGQKGDIF